VTEPAEPAASEKTSSQGWSTKKWVINIVGGLMVGIGGRLLVAFEDRLPSFGIVLPIYTLGLLVSTLVHELGHLVAALLAGFEVVTFAVWPVIIQRAGAKWKLDIWRPGRFSIGGFVSAFPVGTHALVKRMLWITAGGPVASWSLAIFAGAFAIYGTQHSRVWVSTVLTALVFWSFLMGVASLRTYTGTQSLSDGSRFRLLRRGGRPAERFVSIVVLIASSMRGQRPRDWDPDIVHRLACDLDNTPDSMAAQTLRYNWLHDTWQSEEAETLVEWIAERIQSRKGRQVWQFELAWFQARHRANLEGAHESFDRASGLGKSSAVPLAYFKAKAAIDLAEQRWADAEVSAHEVLKETEKLTNAGIAAAIRDEAKEILQELEAAKARKEAV